MAKATPRFFNPHPHEVGVSAPNSGVIYVHPYLPPEDPKRRAELTYEVEGEWFERFTAAHGGPLKPFPQPTEATVAAATGGQSTIDQGSGAGDQGSTPGTGEGSIAGNPAGPGTPAGDPNETDANPAENNSTGAGTTMTQENNPAGGEGGAQGNSNNGSAPEVVEPVIEYSTEGQLNIATVKLGDEVKGTFKDKKYGKVQQQAEALAAKLKSSATK